MSKAASGLAGFSESPSSIHSNQAFYELCASLEGKDVAASSEGLSQFRSILMGLKLRHEAFSVDQLATKQELEAYETRISDLRAELDLKSQDLEALMRKYEAEEKIVRLAKESFEQPQWIDVGGEEVRMVLNRSQANLAEERRALEQRIAGLESNTHQETQELERRLEIANTMLSTVSELRSKIEMPREQREQIFGREDAPEDDDAHEYDNNSREDENAQEDSSHEYDVEQASADTNIDAGAEYGVDPDDADDAYSPTDAVPGTTLSENGSL